jgi:hypothetical protein
VRDKNYGFVYSSLSAVGYGISAAMLPVVTAATLADARDALGVSKKIKGYQSVSLTHFSDLLEPSIAAGSEIEVGGTFYEFPTDETAVAGGWAGIATASVVYMYVVPAGAAHTWIYSTTAPTWDTAKQGWYNGNNRCFGKLFKDASSNYTEKAIAQSLYTVNNTEPLNSYVKMTPVSGYTPAAGDPIETVTDGSSVWIRKAKRLGAALTLGSGTLQCSKCSTFAIDATHALALYTHDATNTLYACILTVDLNDLTISQAGQVTVASGVSVPASDAILLTSTLALVAYTTQPATANMFAVTLSIAGNTITVNGAVDSGTVGWNKPGLVRQSATSGICTYGTSATDCRARAITVAGTVPTWQVAGTNTWAASSVQVYRGILSDDGTLLMVCSIQNIASPYLLSAATFSVAGSTVTGLGIQTMFVSSSVGGAMYITVLAALKSNKFLLMHASSDFAAVMPLGLSLSSVWKYTASNQLAKSQQLPIGSENLNLNAAHLFQVSTAEPVYFFSVGQEYMSTNVRRYKWRFFRISSNELASIEMGDEIRIERDYGVNISVGAPANYGCTLPSSEVTLVPMVGYNAGTANITFVYALRRRNAIIGIAADAAGLVQTSGVFTTAGLTPGKEVSIDDAGALTQAVIGEVKLGIAKSATELMLNVRPGV